MPIKYLDEHELKRFFQVLKSEGNPRDLLLFTWTYRYGLRISEAVGLKLEDLKPSSVCPTEIFIRRKKNGISRHYPINAGDSKLLSRWLKRRSEMPNSEGNQYLFISRRSRLSRITTDAAAKLMTKYGKASGLPREKRHCHTLRHSAAISLLLNGWDISYVRDHLGHRNIQTTMVYTVLAPAEWRKRSAEAIQTGFFV